MQGTFEQNVIVQIRICLDTWLQSSTGNSCFHCNELLGLVHFVMKSIALAAALLTHCSTFALGGSDSIDRLIQEVQLNKAWPTAHPIKGRLNLIREAALKKDVVSDPVSDRYLITALGGPIDIVHFLGLAITVYSGSMDRDAALMKQWKLEGGPDFEAGRSRTYPTEAHPDDLPSNALGALFGEELRAHTDDHDFDVATALKTFLSSLEPQSDDIAKKYSHRVIVMGLTENAAPETARARSEWFSAQPLFSLYAIDPTRAKSIGNSSEALRKAGFELRAIEGRILAIDRIPRKR